MNPVKFGIIGCGYVAQRHARHIQEHQEAELIACYDIEAPKSDKLAQEYSCKSADSLEHFLEQDLDMVNICTPNGNHHLTAIAALKAGKHCLVEKPMSIKRVHCEKMLEASMKANRHLFVVKQNRFNPPVQAVKKLIVENKLGSIQSVDVNCFWNRNAQYYAQSEWRGSKDLDGGCLFTQYSHFIDILYYLFGDIEALFGQSANFQHQDMIEFEDCGNVLFKFKDSNALGNLSFSISAFKQNMEGSISIFAENATIKIGGQYLNMIDYQKTDGFDIENLPSSSSANNYGFYQGSMSNHHKVIHNVVETLKGREEIMTNAMEGMKVVEIIENMYRAMGNGN